MLAFWSITEYPQFEEVQFLQEKRYFTKWALWEAHLSWVFTILKTWLFMLWECCKHWSTLDIHDRHPHRRSSGKLCSKQIFHCYPVFIAFHKPKWQSSCWSVNTPTPVSVKVRGGGNSAFEPCICTDSKSAISLLEFRFLACKTEEITSLPDLK